MSTDVGGTRWQLTVDDDIELRGFEDADADRLFALVDANRTHLRRWLPWLDATATIEAERAFVERSRLQAERDDGVQYGIWHQGALVGAIGHVGISWSNRATEIGYWLAEDAQGRGIITRATSALVSQAFSELRLHRVVIRCATENTRSAAVPRRLGFHLEGTHRDAEWLYDHYVDHHVFAMLAPDWRARA